MNPIAYVVIAVILGGLAYNFFRNHTIKTQGIEVDGFITRVEETDSTDSDGDITTSYHYYVRYTDQSGMAREAVLTNTYTRRNLVPGYPVRIKYLPGKENAAVMVKGRN